MKKTIKKKKNICDLFDENTYLVYIIYAMLQLKYLYL